MQLLPAAQLGRSERVVVERDRVRLERLDEDAPGRTSPPGASGDLDEKLDAALRRAEIRQVQRPVRVQDAHQGHARKVVSLRHHLRSDQDVELPAREAREQRGSLARSARRIPIEPSYPGPGHHGLQLLLNFFRAASQGDQLRAPATGACPARTLLVSAEMAAEPLAAGAVQHQRDRAVGAAHRRAAGSAEKAARMAAAVEEQDGLLAAGERFPQCAGQLGREQLVRNAALHHRDRRQGPRLDALRQAQRAQLSFLGAPERLQRRRGAAEDRDGLRLLRADQRQIARMVPEPLLLLVRGLVLLVDDEDSQLRDGRPDGSSRSHHDTRATLPDALPLGDPFRVRETRMKHRDVGAEAAPEPAGELRRQRDLRDQRDRAQSPRPRVRDGLQVHPGLAAAGHAMQQEGRERPRIDGRDELAERRRLRGRRVMSLLSPGRLGQGRRTRRNLVELGEAPRGERAEVGTPVGEGRHHFLDRDRGAAREEPGEHFRLPGRAPQGIGRCSRCGLRGFHELWADAGARFLAHQRHQPASRQLGELRPRELHARAHSAQRPPRCFFLTGKIELPGLEQGAAGLGQAGHQGVADVHAGRQGRFEGGPERRQVVSRGPAGQGDDVRGQQRSVVQESHRVAHLALRRARTEHDPGLGATAQGHHHAPAGLGRAELRSDPVGENAVAGGNVQRDRIQLIRRNRLPLRRPCRARPSPRAPRSGQRAGPHSRAR